MVLRTLYAQLIDVPTSKQIFALWYLLILQTFSKRRCKSRLTLFSSPPQPTRALLSPQSLLSAEPQGGVLPGAGAGGGVPADAHAGRAGLLVPRQHQRQVPVRVLQSWIRGW